MSKRRIAFAGHDFFSSCLTTLTARTDTEVVLCLTSEPDGPVSNVTDVAHRHGIPVLFGRPTRKNAIRAFNDARVDILITAGYAWRIPVDRLAVTYAVNIHPSLLPDGRGPNPLPYILDEHRDLRAITLHEMTSEFDQGAIILQRPLAIEDGTGFDELSLQLFAETPHLVNQFLDDPVRHFSRKAGQGPGSYWPEHVQADKTFVAAQSEVDDAVRVRTKFGALGTFVELADGTTIKTFHLTAARCDHSYTPGTLVGHTGLGYIVALRDGLVRLDTLPPAIRKSG
ncbi:formyltransferase family protein [Actinokineospora enzanensis]|uniref:formyltransferase family protein n=1 Tax=Actinokineospora enzanensis TaxID=155975 RepID=UPI00035E4F45|nr:formyltransferase family protein [Actinokineospora enzanensis]